MQTTNPKHLELEILISTMFQTDFSFLEKMFPHEHFSNYNIIIINQTTEDKVLTSELSHIKVINCFEFGVPKSRNLAINNATADVCLMADDDVVYKPNLKQVVLDAHQQHPEAAMISFEAVDEHNKLYTDYYLEGIHNKKTLSKIYTWVISFKREAYKKQNILYSRYFGFGAPFKGSEEYVFLRNAYDKGVMMVHKSKTIVMHPFENSGKLMGSDDVVLSKSAMKYRFIGNLSYIWLVKYVFFIWRNKYIKAHEIIPKFKLGLKGISAYKKLNTAKQID